MVVQLWLLSRGLLILSAHEVVLSWLGGLRLLEDRLWLFFDGVWLDLIQIAEDRQLVEFLLN